MRCFLLNAAEVIVHVFDATDIPDARQQMVAKCLADQATYRLAVVVRVGRYNRPLPAPEVVDDPA